MKVAKILNWMIAFDEAVHYDPQDQTDKKMKYLTTQINHLSSKIEKFEAIGSERIQ